MVGQLHPHTMPAYLPLPTLRPQVWNPSQMKSQCSIRAGPQSLDFRLERNLHVRPHHNSAGGSCYGLLPVHAYRR